MKMKKLLVLGMAAVLAMGSLAGCKKSQTADGKNGKEIVELTWYQIGDAQKDSKVVEEKVNEYLADKIGVKLNIISVG